MKMHKSNLDEPQRACALGSTDREVYWLASISPRKQNYIFERSGSNHNYITEKPIKASTAAFPFQIQYVELGHLRPQSLSMHIYR